MVCLKEALSNGKVPTPNSKGEYLICNCGAMAMARLVGETSLAWYFAPSDCEPSLIKIETLDDLPKPKLDLKDWLLMLWEIPCEIFFPTN